MKNPQRDIRLAVAAGCSSAEEYDLKAALFGAAPSFRCLDRFWLYFKLAPVKKLLDRFDVTYGKFFCAYFILFFVAGFTVNPDWSALIPFLCLAVVFLAVSFLYLMYFVTDCQISEAKLWEDVLP